MSFQLTQICEPASSICTLQYFILLVKGMDLFYQISGLGLYISFGCVPPYLAYVRHVLQSSQNGRRFVTSQKLY